MLSKFFPNTKEHALTRQAAEGVARGGAIQYPCIHLSTHQESIRFSPISPLHCQISSFN